MTKQIMTRACVWTWALAIALLLIILAFVTAAAAATATATSTDVTRRLLEWMRTLPVNRKITHRRSAANSLLEILHFGSHFIGQRQQQRQRPTTVSASVVHHPLRAIIFLPGLGGSPLTKAVAAAAAAATAADRHVWMHPRRMLFDQRRWVRDMLDHDATMVHPTSNPEMLWSSPLGVHVAYLWDLLRELRKHGMDTDVAFRTVCYDWRVCATPKYQREYQNRLKTEIEAAYWRSGARPVVVVAHSLGGLMAAPFWASMPLAWKRKHVAAYVSVSVPYAGCSKAVRALLQGTMGPPVKRAGFAIQRRIQGGLMALPTAATTPSFSFVHCVSSGMHWTPSGGGGDNGWCALLRSVQHADWRLYSDYIATHLVPTYTIDPGVPTVVVTTEMPQERELRNSLGQGTEVAYVMLERGRRVVVINEGAFGERGRGDGTVPAHSLHLPLRAKWKSVVEHIHVPDVHHSVAIRKPFVAEAVLRACRR